MTQPGGKLQPIRKFTAQVRKPNGHIVGTAFAVDFRRALLVTCKHVVEAVTKPCVVGAAVDVYFPLISGEKEEKLFPAKVARMFDDHDDDVVILKLDADTLPPGVEMAVLGDAERSHGFPEQHEFVTYGFITIENYEGVNGEGVIVGFAGKSDCVLHGELVQLKSQDIDSGMSGAAVLDKTRNLVVGVVAEVWDSGKDLANRDLSFAVDCSVLRIAPLNLELHQDWQLPLTSDPPPTEQAQERAAANVVVFPLEPEYRPAEPPTLPEWVGRAVLLKQLDMDYANPAVHITSLIGFGGEGKSSLAFKWVVQLLAGNPPDAAFWWNFYDNRSSEAMLEELARYLYGDVAQQWTSTAARAEAVGAMLYERRVLLVLDGFEVMQDPDGDDYGTVANRDVLRLLELCAQGEHPSFCLVTSRAPLRDLLSHIAHVQREVAQLELADGVQLLRNVGLTGTDAALETIVNDWHAHALTVTLIGAYLRDTEGGDAGRYDKTMFPELDVYAEKEKRYQGVGRILVRYDKHLSEAERAFLKLFSVFRLPVPESAFDRVFRTETGPDAVNVPLTGLDDAAFAALVTRLEERRLIRRGAGQFTTHPLVRNHYLRLLESESRAAQNVVHKAAAEHYQEAAATQKQSTSLYAMLGVRDTPTLDDLQPYIEVVHHLCRAGAYDEAYRVYRDRVDQGDRWVITSILGAYETEYNLLLEFFPNRDPTGDPQVSRPGEQRFILNEVGFCLMNLGRLAASVLFTERSNAMAVDMGDHSNASAGYNNLTTVYVQTGQLAQASEAAAVSLAQARQVTDERNRQQDETRSLVWAAWIAYLYGNLNAAGDTFQQAEVLEHAIDSSMQYLYSIRGVQHADHLRRAGAADYARRVTDANITVNNKHLHNPSLESQCHRVLGDLDTDSGTHDAAQAHYEQALTIARGIDRRDVLIEALIAYGRWRALHGGEVASGRGLLDEALGYCIEDGFVFYEADARVALAQVALAEGDTATASTQAAQALAIGAWTGYHWAQVDAQAVLDQVGPES